MLPDMDDRIKSAAEAIEQAMFDMHRDERGVHANTLICTTAAVLGEAVLRAVVPEAQLYGDRGIIFSDPARELICEAEDGNVLDYLVYTAQEVGMDETQFPDIEEIFEATAAGVNTGDAEIPVLTVSEDQRPMFWSIAGAAFARQQVLDIYAANKLTPIEAVLGGTLVLCRFLNGTKEVLASDVAFRLALETLIGTTKLHPVALEDLEGMTEQ
ncbi:MAG: hypothetical protein WBK91_05035 [Alphaproteobacteria bacterium]